MTEDRIPNQALLGARRSFRGVRCRIVALHSLSASRVMIAYRDPETGRQVDHWLDVRELGPEPPLTDEEEDLARTAGELFTNPRAVLEGGER